MWDFFHVGKLRQNPEYSGFVSRAREQSDVSQLFRPLPGEVPESSSWQVWSPFQGECEDSIELDDDNFKPSRSCFYWNSKGTSHWQDVLYMRKKLRFWALYQTVGVIAASKRLLQQGSGTSLEEIVTLIYSRMMYGETACEFDCRNTLPRSTRKIITSKAELQCCYFDVTFFVAISWRVFASGSRKCGGCGLCLALGCSISLDSVEASRPQGFGRQYQRCTAHPGHCTWSRSHKRM